MSVIKRTIRRIIRGTGFDVVRYGKELGANPFADMRRFLKAQESPVIFDVGANIGQSVARFKDAFPGARIHSFEPSPSTYEILKNNCGNISNVETWNYGVGSSDGVSTFSENSQSDMSSFLLPSTSSWGKIIRSTDVRVVTLDSFSKDQNIDFIHILKSDTQGYDFEVFKGADRLMENNSIAMIYFEFIFSDMYEQLPSFDEVFRYLSDRGFALVAFYEQHFQDELVSWTDALFISRDFKREGLRRTAANGTAPREDS